MLSIVLAVHVLLAIAVITLVLLQHGKGADTGAAFGSGGAGTVFGSRGPTTFLTHLTAILVTVFFLTSLSLGFLAKQQVDRRSEVERVQTEQTGVPENPAPAPSAADTLEAPIAPAESDTGTQE